MSFQKQIAQSLVWRGLYFISVLVINIFLSRYLGSRDSGLILYLSNNFSLIVIVAGLTMEASINYYSSKKSIDDNQLAWFAIMWSVLVSVAVFIVMRLYFGKYESPTATTHNDYLYYAICYIAGIQLTNCFTVLFYANRNFFLPNFLMVILNTVLIIIIPKQSGTENTDTSLIIKIYFAFFVITGVVLAVAFLISKQSWKKVSLPAFKNIRLLIRYALMALAANVIFFLVYRLDYWFVKKYCTAEELGNYIQVSKLGQMLLIIPTIIASVILPHTAAEATEHIEMKQNIMRIGRIITVLYFILFLLTVLTGKLVFPFVFGETFQLMYVPFLLLIPGIWALSNMTILNAYFAGINKVKINVQGAGLALLVILAGDLIFIPQFGIFAAAIASTAGYAVNFIYLFSILQKEHPVSISKYWNLNKEDIIWLRSIIHK
ncbi:MAG TPA: polysaccharide biosynthesis C-terminal domain-containing protein [Segetibacter sp.]